MGLFSGIMQAAGPALSVGGLATGNPMLMAAGSAIGGLAANQFNADQAQLNRDYQTQMSNTSYQRAVEDMKAAGLNPMLAYSQGGASTPSGSATPGSGNIADTAVNTGTTAQIRKQELQNMEAQRQATIISADKTASETNRILELLPWEQAKLKADIQQSQANAKLAASNTVLNTLAVPKATNEAGAESSWWKKNVSPYLPDIGKVVSGASGATNIVRGR